MKNIKIVRDNMISLKETLILSEGKNYMKRQITYTFYKEEKHHNGESFQEKFLIPLGFKKDKDQSTWFQREKKPASKEDLRCEFNKWRKNKTFEDEDSVSVGECTETGNGFEKYKLL